MGAETGALQPRSGLTLPTAPLLQPKVPSILPGKQWDFLLLEMFPCCARLAASDSICSAPRMRTQRGWRMLQGYEDARLTTPCHTAEPKDSPQFAFPINTTSAPGKSPFP